MHDDHGSRKTRLPGGFFVLIAKTHRRFLPKAKEGKQDTAHVDRLAQARGQLLIAVEGRRFCAQRKEAERDSFDA
jgi:hypothetical protein